MVQEVYHLSRHELELRWSKARAALAELAPEAGGLLVFQRMHIYWLTGTLAMGACWLPLEGEPVLFCRKGIERARAESAVRSIVEFRSFKDLSPLAKEAGNPLAKTVAVQTAGLSWQMGDMLKARVTDTAFVPGDTALAVAQSVKTGFELDVLRRCGAKHHQALHDLLPGRIAPGMTEQEIAHISWEVFYSLGHMGHMRMQSFGEEIFLGHVSAGESGNHSSAFNGPLGVVGEHPAIPYMGSAEITWQPGSVLACDIGFSLEGYCTDKTQVYFAGPGSVLPDELRRAHDFCIRIQARAAETAKPGNTPAQVWQASLELAESEGMMEGFMGQGGNKVPFVGHGIGLAIDTYPPLAAGFDRPLEAGCVLAIEPKQAVPGLGMVGVENTFEVREGGAACITGDEYEIVCVE